jgi:hypothetical protein
MSLYRLFYYQCYGKCLAYPFMKLEALTVTETPRVKVSVRKI